MIPDRADIPTEPIALLMAATDLRWPEVRRRRAVSPTWPSLPVASSVIHLGREGAGRG